MSDLIDTTEMYLKTVYELVEEGIPALRARIVERLEQSGPTVSETVARMERDGLVVVGENREIEFTREGLDRACHVMRRHRLAERLLVDVIKLDWPRVHEEACRWEHVLSDEVAERISEMLDEPDSDPFGNVIPNRAAQDPAMLAAEAAGLKPLAEVVKRAERGSVEVVRLAEAIQVFVELLEDLYDAGVVPGARVAFERAGADGILLHVAGGAEAGGAEAGVAGAGGVMAAGSAGDIVLSRETARSIFVRESGGDETK